MIIHSEQEMIAFGKTLTEGLVLPATIELIGDVGTGKTTLTKGIAAALNIQEPITSPSFTISKTYSSLPVLSTPPKKDVVILNHFDFYRLSDPGIMSEDLAESISAPNTLTVIEWAETVHNTLPKNRLKIQLTYRKDGTREAKKL